MKTVTTAFTESLEDPNPAWSRSVYYKRRYWDAATQSYTWETDWTALDEDQIVSVAQISWQLDSDRLNEFRTSSVNVLLNNQSKQWKPENRAGNFGPDAIATRGYEPYWSKFQLRVSLELVDTTEEEVTIFTGLAVNYIEDSESGTINVELAGPEAKMQRSDAERVSTTITEESLGTGDGATTAFTTDNAGVGIINEVSIAGLRKRAGVDYTISNLNEPNLPATITFIVAPIAATALRVSYVYWQQDQTFEDLIADLCEEAGVTSGDRIVSPVTFPNSVINTNSYQSNAEWATGTLTSIDTTTRSNAIQYATSNTATAYTDAASGWTTHFLSGSLADHSDGIQFIPSSTFFHGCCSRAHTKAYGTWQFKYTIDTSDIISGSQFIGFHFLIKTVDMTPPSSTEEYMNEEGYAVGWDYFSQKLVFRKHDSASHYIDKAYFSMNSATFGGTHTITVRRVSDTFYIYFDGVLRITSTDSSSPHTTCSYIGFSARYSQNVGNSPIVFWSADFWAGNATTADGTWVSPTIDLGGTPTSWGSFLYSETLNGGTTTYETRTSADGISWDAYVAIAGAVVGSTKRRYVQIRIVITIVGETGDPYVSLITLSSLTASTIVTLANFTGLTCYDAITALAQFADYEFGFKSDETFFFRSKTTLTEPQATLDKTLLKSVPSVVYGFDRVYSKVRATYGTYSTDATSDGLYWLSGLARVSRARLDLDGGNILIDEDADVATGVANAYLNRYSQLRRRPKLNAKLLPHLELSDVVEVSFADNLPQGWTLGDSSVILGDTALELYGKNTQILHEFIGKVIGLRFDTDTWQTELDLEEILNV